MFNKKEYQKEYNKQYYLKHKNPLINMTNYYTTYEVAKLLPNYSNSKTPARTLLQALHNNQKLIKSRHKGELKSNTASKDTLSAIWNARFRLSKRWLYKKEDIDNILMVLQESD